MSTKALAGSKQFEEIIRKQGWHRKNQGVGFERKFNANGVEWEEDQYPKTKFVPSKEKYDPTSFKGTQAQDDLPPQDHKQKERISYKMSKTHMKNLLKLWSSGSPRLLQVPLHQVLLQLQGFPSS